jgi:hypothetical protein
VSIQYLIVFIEQNSQTAKTTKETTVKALKGCLSNWIIPIIQNDISYMIDGKGKMTDRKMFNNNPIATKMIANHQTGKLITKIIGNNDIISDIIPSKRPIVLSPFKI